MREREWGGERERQRGGGVCILVFFCIQMFSIEMPYLAVTEVQADYPEQITVIQDQPVRVLDSKRNDWWLVSSIPEEENEEESLLPVEGWIKASLLRPDG